MRVFNKILGHAYLVRQRVGVENKWASGKKRKSLSNEEDEPHSNEADRPQSSCSADESCEPIPHDDSLLPKKTITYYYKWTSIEARKTCLHYVELSAESRWCCYLQCTTTSQSPRAWPEWDCLKKQSRDVWAKVLPSCQIPSSSQHSTWWPTKRYQVLLQSQLSQSTKAILVWISRPKNWRNDPENYDRRVWGARWYGSKQQSSRSKCEISIKRDC